MQPGEKISVLHILHEKYGDLIMPNILEFDLFLTKDREIFSHITQAENSLGNSSFITRTGYLFEGTKEELLQWFRDLSTTETFFFFDCIFSYTSLGEEDYERGGEIYKTKKF